MASLLDESVTPSSLFHCRESSIFRCHLGRSQLARKIEIGHRAGISRIEAQRRSVSLDRFGEAFERLENVAALGVEARVIGTEGQRHVNLIERRCQLSFVDEEPCLVAETGRRCSGDM